MFNPFQCIHIHFTSCADPELFPGEWGITDSYVCCGKGGGSEAPVYYVYLKFDFPLDGGGDPH